MSSKDIDVMFDVALLRIPLTLSPWLCIFRSEAISQLKSLKAVNWLDRKTGAVFIELTLYNTQSNLFTAVKLLAEMSPDGTVCTSVKVTSAQLFRYVTLWDNVLLGCEVRLYIVYLVYDLPDF